MLEEQLESTNVLVIEDNPDDRIFLEYHLKHVKSRELTVEWRERLADGLELIAQGWPDIVFLDLSLPDSFGISTVKKVRAQAPSLSIVVLTGMDDDEVAIDAIKGGAQDYLVKGQLSPSLLGRSINYAIERQRAASVTQWFSAVLENSSFAIIGKSLQNKILSWNYGAEKIFGYRAADVIDKPMSLLFCRGGNIDLCTNDYKTAQAQECEYAECQAYRKDGEEICVSLTISPIKTTEGSVSASSILVRDITREKRLQTDLRVTDERLSLAVGAAKLGLWDLRNDELHWNDTMYDLMGLTSKSEAPSLESFFNLMNQEDRARIEDALKTVGPFDLDFRVSYGVDETRYITFKGNVLESDQRGLKQISGVCFDITEKKLAEQALLSSERTLRFALQSAGMGAWSYDYNTKKVSRSAFHDAIYGYDHMLNDWSYSMLMGRVLPEDQDALRQAAREITSKPNFSIDYRIVHAGDDSVRWLRSQGELVTNEKNEAELVIGTVKDITESKRLEEQLQEAQQRREQILHNIVQHAPIGVAILDAALRITDGNLAFASMIGQDLKQVINLPIAEVIPTGHLLDTQPMTKTGTPIQINGLKINTHTTDRNLQYWDLSLWPIMGPGETMSGGVLLAIDRTKTVLLEQQREDFLAAVAHDIKNPLIGASRVLELLCKQPHREDDPNVPLMIALRDSNRSLLSLVQNLVDICKYDTLEYPCCFEAVQMDNVMQSCVQQIQHFAELSQVAIQTKIVEPVTAIQADETAVRRVLMNIFHNAVKFNRKGGLLRIDLEQRDGTTKISVTDSGEGMPEADKAKLFQRFSQGIEGRKYTSGSGLGLYLSKQIIDAHGGNIDCQSKQGEGTTFIISLPNNPAEKLAAALTR
ncbi:MAG TPA: PAS domain S-box protein [Oculatellaceae cyanobacterium]